MCINAQYFASVERPIVSMYKGFAIGIWVSVTECTSEQHEEYAEKFGLLEDFIEVCSLYGTCHRYSVVLGG